MKSLTWVLAGWISIRWVGLALGSWRLRRLTGEAHWQVKRWGTVRRSVTVMLTVFWVYTFAYSYGAKPVPGFASWLALGLLASGAYWIAARFMLPDDTDPRLMYVWTVRGLPPEVPYPVEKS